MDSFDLIAEPVQRKRKFGAVWIGLGMLALLSVLCVGAAFLMVKINPQVDLNLSSPRKDSGVVTLPTGTRDVQMIQPATRTATATRKPTWTPAPTKTATPTDVPTRQRATSTPTQQPPASTYSLDFEVQQGNPVALPNIGHPDDGCNWAGIAGQATGVDGAPIVGLFVKLVGMFDGKVIDVLTMTGTATQYGMGGYEITLGEEPANSTGTLRLQLYNQAMLPLSHTIRFDTYEDCERNLILINFVQIR
jgi:hypothetical protein